jgi:hypothetical protein
MTSLCIHQAYFLYTYKEVLKSDSKVGENLFDDMLL